METELPLRPMTVGELLDASVVLLRRCGPPLLLLGLVLAAGQQALVELLAPAPAGHWWHHVTAWWLRIGFFLGTESMVIPVLAAPASVAAAGALLGRPLPRRRLLAGPGQRWPGVLLAALVIGAVTMGGAYACGLPWLVCYAAVGLVVPVLVIDRATGLQVLSRPLVLLGRGGLRAGWIRLLGWLGWLAVRCAVGFGAATLLGELPFEVPYAAVLGWVVVDGLAFSALACLDACLHLENRMRVEGLDLALATATGSRRSVLAAIP